MALKLTLVGSSMILVGFTTYRLMAKTKPSLFTEKSFYEEALILTRGYKPIREKLVEPIQPLKIDTGNTFNQLKLLSAQVQIPIRGAERSGTVYCYATRESLDDEWHVDQLEFKANNQPSRFLFYDRAYRRVPTPTEQALIDYKKELQERIASGMPPKTVS